MEKRNARHRAVKAGKLTEAEAKKLKSKALLQDAASVGIAAMGIKGAISEMKEAREMSHEVSEWKEKKEERNAQFKIVSKRDSAIMPDKGYPGGWVNRAQERSEAAQQGEGWKSAA